MYRRILVGSDTTNESMLAVCRAVEVARSFDCRLDVVVIDTTPARSGGCVDDSVELMTSLVDLCSLFGVTPTEHHAVGDTAEALMAIADQVGAGLIVVSGFELGQQVQRATSSRSTAPDVLVVGTPLLCPAAG